MNRRLVHHRQTRISVEIARGRRSLSRRHGKHFPAMTMVQVSALIEDETQAEVEASALVPRLSCRPGREFAGPPRYQGLRSMQAPVRSLSFEDGLRTRQNR